MGKKKKIQINEDTQIKKKKTDNTNFNSSNINEQDEVNINDASSTRKERNDKKQKNKNLGNPKNVEEIIDEDSKLDDLIPQLEKIRKKKKFKKEKSPINKPQTNSLPISKSKKIVFVDDEPCEVPVIAETPETTNNVEKQKKFLNDDEAEVKDEDIDKFCDELDEEANKQYEDWIKLIEAKLHENKKSK